MNNHDSALYILMQERSRISLTADAPHRYMFPHRSKLTCRRLHSPLRGFTSFHQYQYDYIDYFLKDLWRVKRCAVVRTGNTFVLSRVVKASLAHWQNADTTVASAWNSIFVQLQPRGSNEHCMRAAPALCQFKRHARNCNVT